MPNDVVLPPPWSEFLREVDALLPEPITLHAIGGFVLTVLYALPRSTNDLDYLSVSRREGSRAIEEIAGRDSKLAQRYKVFIHGTGIVDLPEGYEDRLQVIPLPYKRLQIAAPDPYDLALSKLTRNSPKDRDDVKFLAAKCQLFFATLMDRFEKEMDWIPNVDRHRTTLELWRQLGCWIDEQPDTDGALNSDPS